MERILRHGYGRSVRCGRRIEKVTFPCQHARAPPVRSQVEYTGFGLERPARVRDGLAPKKPSGCLRIADLFRSGREGPYGIRTSVRKDADQPRREGQSLLYGENVIAGRFRTLERGVAAGRGCKRPGRPEGTPRRFVRGPKGLLRRSNLLPGLLKVLARSLLHRFLEVEERQGEHGGEDVFIVSGREQGVIVHVSHTGHQHVSRAVMVRNEGLLRTPAPAVPVAEIPFGETDAVMLQEVRRAAAPGACKGGFRHDGVALQQRRARIKRGRCAGEKLSDNGIEQPESPATCELHLRDVARLVDGQFRDPVQRLGAARVGTGEQVHPARGPGNGAVGLCRKAVQDHRHGPAVHAVGGVTDAGA